MPTESLQLIAMVLQKANLYVLQALRTPFCSVHSLDVFIEMFSRRADVTACIFLRI